MTLASRPRLSAAAVCFATVLIIGRVWSQSSAISITLTGQSRILSDIRATAPAAVPAIRSLLKGDVILTNFEATVAEKGESVQQSQDRGYFAPPAALDALQTFGFNLISLSNNHAFDFKVAGIQNVLRDVKGRNLVHAGIGNTLEEATAPGYLKTPKGSIALVSMASGLIQPGGSATSNRPGVNELRIEAAGEVNEGTRDLPEDSVNKPNVEDAQRILGSIQEAKRHANLVIVYEHNHVFGHTPFGTLFSEELPERLEPADWLKKWTHAEVDAGADIIFMHGAPVVHGVEIYRNKPIFYDLGNFIFNSTSGTALDEPIIWESVVAYVQFEGTQLRSISFCPIVMNKDGEGEPSESRYTDTRGLPAPASGRQAGYILGRLANASRPFGTTVIIKGDRAEIDLTAAH
jgi:poly-gamma-glutamate capsule biosynthesis protein CapA/YwtB (metallophosphatase superfamily)